MKRQVDVDDIDPIEIDPTIFNPIINAKCIQYKFTEDAWALWEMHRDNKSRYYRHMCTRCMKNDENDDDLINCEHCLKSFHYGCINLNKTKRKRKKWFCPVCKIKAAQKKSEI